MKIAVVLNTHEDSPTFRDTLESVLHHWTDRVLVVVDAKGAPNFKSEIPAMRLDGFYHGKASAPYRNVCLGLMKAWEIWKGWADWVCYMEYDCLVCSEATKNHLSAASTEGIWLLGNDLRVNDGRIPFLDRLEKSPVSLKYLLGCCLFFNREFLSELESRNFFERFLGFTNFNLEEPRIVAAGGREEQAYDVSEFVYPSLASHYGGKVAELACWEGSGWRGEGARYPMRFRPEVEESSYDSACVIHPLKNFDGPVRSFHRLKRKLTLPSGGAMISVPQFLKGAKECERSPFSRAF